MADAPPPYTPPSKGQAKMPDGQQAPPYPSDPNNAYLMPHYVQQGPQTTTVVIDQCNQPSRTVIIQGNDPNCAAVFSHSAVTMVCPHCLNPVTTEVESGVSPLGLACACVCCLFGLWLFAWIPLVLGTFKEIKHKCPYCHVTLGIVRE